MSDTQSSEPTAEILKWLDHNHRTLRNCPTCGEDCATGVGITALAYYFITCECGEPEYPHLVEQLTHLSCLAEGGAIEPAVRHLLDSAGTTARRYKRGQDTADRIDAFLARNQQKAGEIA